MQLSSSLYIHYNQVYIIDFSDQIQPLIWCFGQLYSVHYIKEDVCEGLQLMKHLFILFYEGNSINLLLIQIQLQWWSQCISNVIITIMGFHKNITSSLQ